METQDDRSKLQPRGAEQRTHAHTSSCRDGTCVRCEHLTAGACCRRGSLQIPMMHSLPGRDVLHFPAASAAAATAGLPHGGSQRQPSKAQLIGEHERPQASQGAPALLLLLDRRWRGGGAPPGPPRAGVAGELAAVRLRPPLPPLPLPPPLPAWNVPRHHRTASGVEVHRHLPSGAGQRRSCAARGCLITSGRSLPGTRARPVHRATMQPGRQRG